MSIHIRVRWPWLAMAWLCLFPMLFLATKESVAQETSVGRKYALLVGVKTYPKDELRSLKYTEADVEALAQVLRDNGYRRVVVLTQKSGAEDANLLPTGRNIRDQLQGLMEDRQAADSVLIAFSGHGVQFKGSKENYFCPSDTRLRDRQTLVSLEEVYGRLERCTARSRVLLVDACRNDPQSDESKGIGEVLESVTRPQQEQPPGGVAALFSCSEGQQSFESDGLKHGIFFHTVLAGLKGKAANDRGEVTWKRLEAYVEEEVPDTVKDQIGPTRRQTPSSRGDLSGTLVLAKVSGKSPISGIPGATQPLMAGARDVLKINGVDFAFRYCPPGKFTMGSPKTELRRDDDTEDQVDVTLTKGFWLGETEVTQAQWIAIVGTEPWKGQRDPFAKEGGHVKEGADYPAQYVDCRDATEYCAKLTAAGQVQGPSTKFALPTEAQWEYACRAGTTTRWSFGDDENRLEKYAWYYENTVGLNEFYAHAVAQKKPNPWGLYDMHGNVSEWCRDKFDDKLPGGFDPVSNRRNQDNLRGGFFRNFGMSMRSASRWASDTDDSTSGLGFRLLRME